MKVGDVVNFVSHSWVTDRDYPNPGVVHEVHRLDPKRWDRHGNGPVGQHRITVLWSNGTLTSEHPCYLEVISD